MSEGESERSGDRPPVRAAEAGERGPIPYERFQQVVGERNQFKTSAEQYKAELEALTAQHRTTAEALARAEQQRDAAQGHAQRIRIAHARGLPIELADRLAGKDEVELGADAERLAALIRPASPGVPPAAAPGAGHAAFDLESMSPAQIREKAAEIMMTSRYRRSSQE
ncbi:MAG: hypothetical protein ACM3JD_02470 [Rudaea sp.]